MSEKIVVGMSGGVDSSVAALLLKEQGYDVIGVTMQIWQEEDPLAVEEQGGCCGLSAVEDARRVAEAIGIPHYVMNFRDVFREKVIDYFTDEYLHARTPNPCIACNRYVKWEALLTRSLEIGADRIATGHYADIRRLENGRLAVCGSDAEEKDQTYALYNLTQEQLARTVFPLARYTKPEVREIAKKAGLPVAHKPDSQEICFVPDNDYARFIEEYTGTPACPGNFVRPDGTVLGRHKGLIHYTVGQRRGLGLPMGERIFVSELRPETNEVVLVSNGELFSRVVKARKVSFMALEDLPRGTGAEEGGTFIGKIRYNHRGAPCTAVRSGEDEITVVFDEPVRAAAKGQALVLYKDGCIAAGGTII